MKKQAANPDANYDQPELSAEEVAAAEQAQAEAQVAKGGNYGGW